MRYVFILLCGLMLLFVAVQYNDPDGPLWMAIYGVPALFSGLAAYQPQWLRTGAGRWALLAAIAAAAVTVVHYWPTTSHFWWTEVWWKTETAREGMGVMIGTLVLLVVLAGTSCSDGRVRHTD